MQAARRLIVTTTGIPYSSRETGEQKRPAPIKLKLVPAPAPASLGEPLLTAAQVAKHLGVSEQWVTLHRRSLPFRIDLSERSIRYSPSGLKKWLKSKEEYNARLLQYAWAERQAGLARMRAWVRRRRLERERAK
jgi:predicted DNA-binding transcriptional regulator AlpA